MKKIVILLLVFIFIFSPHVSFASHPTKPLPKKELSGKKIYKISTISQEDLWRIPLAEYNFLTDKDSDKDGLSDKLEQALGTNPFNLDSDSDSYDDKTEFLHEYSPFMGENKKLPLDSAFAKSKKNFLLIQKNKSSSVAWYVGAGVKTYFLGDTKTLKKSITQAGLKLAKGVTLKSIQGDIESLIAAKSKSKKFENCDVNINVVKRYTCFNKFLKSCSLAYYSIPVEVGGVDAKADVVNSFKIIGKGSDSNHCLIEGGYRAIVQGEGGKVVEKKNICDVEKKNFEQSYANAVNSDSCKSTVNTTSPPAKPKTSLPEIQAKNPDLISKAHTTFGINMFKELFKEGGDKSIFISPASIALALSMVFNGAQGETKETMQKALQLKGIDTDTLNKESLGLLHILENPDPKIELLIANSLWAKKGYDFKNDFIDTLKNYFLAQATTLDFSDPQAVSTINSWVSKNTKNKILNILTPPIPSDSVMYLMNAVYFKGSWSQEFDKKLTEEREFTNSSKVVKKHPLMKQERKMPYLETPDFQSVKLEYGANKRLNMVVFLPKKDLQSFIETFDDKKWNEWMNSYKQTRGTLFLPRFKMEYEKSLVSVLTKIGMGIAFNGEKGDFSGIGKGLKISEVKHKTYIDVGEEGTEAAAVTSVEMNITSVEIPVDKPFVMEVNRPFFYAIQDAQSGEIIFMGTLSDVSK